VVTVNVPTQWVKARKSTGNGSCVEARRNGEHIEVRNSRDASGPVLRFTPAEWDAFLHGARHAEFDHLV
jgi:hypothetical protein